jgi:hypothetical protein
MPRMALKMDDSERVRRIPKMPVKTLPMPMEMGNGLYAGRTGGRMPRSAGGAIRYKDIYMGDHLLPKVVYGGEVNMGSLMDTSHPSYQPFQSASTPMMPFYGKGLF